MSGYKRECRAVRKINRKLNVNVSNMAKNIKDISINITKDEIFLMLFKLIDKILPEKTTPTLTSVSKDKDGNFHFKTEIYEDVVDV